MLGDPVLLERLVGNLVENAVKYNVEAGEITIRSGLYEGMPAVQVENSGKVIPAYEIEGLFEPFRRSTGDRSCSAGLGLSIVRSVVQAQKVWSPPALSRWGPCGRVCLPAVKLRATLIVDRCDRPTSLKPRYREMGLSCTAPHFRYLYVFDDTYPCHEHGPEVGSFSGRENGGNPPDVGMPCISATVKDTFHACPTNGQKQLYGVYEELGAG